MLPVLALQVERVCLYQVEVFELGLGPLREVFPVVFCVCVVACFHNHLALCDYQIVLRRINTVLFVRDFICGRGVQAGGFIYVFGHLHLQILDGGETRPRGP